VTIRPEEHSAQKFELARSYREFSGSRVHIKPSNANHPPVPIPVFRRFARRTNVPTPPHHLSLTNTLVTRSSPLGTISKTSRSVTDPGQRGIFSACRVQCVQSSEWEFSVFRPGPIRQAV